MSNCKNNPNFFCYVCGKFEVARYRKKMTDTITNIYYNCFKIHVSNQNEYWVPNISCNKCYTALIRWNKGSVNALKLKEPMKWRQPTNHDDCYFCKINLSGYNSKNKENIEYPTDVSSVDFPVLKTDADFENNSANESAYSPMEVDESACSEDDIHSEESEEEDVSNLKTPQKFNQMELNDLIRDLALSKECSELLASRLKEKYLLEEKTNVTFYRTREKNFVKYFDEEDSLVYCNDIIGLFKK